MEQKHKERQKRQVNGEDGLLPMSGQLGYVQHKAHIHICGIKII